MLGVYCKTSVFKEVHLYNHISLTGPSLNYYYHKRAALSNDGFALAVPSHLSSWGLAVLENVVHNSIHTVVTYNGLKTNTYVETIHSRTSFSIYAFDGNEEKTSHSRRTGKTFTTPNPARAK